MLCHRRQKWGCILTNGGSQSCNHYFFGLQVRQTQTNLYLTQTKYALDLILHAKMAGCKPIGSAIPIGSKLSRPKGLLFLMLLFIGESLAVPTPQYPTLITAGSLICRQSSLQVHACSKFNHWLAVKCILSFVKGTLDHCLHFWSSSFDCSIDVRIIQFVFRILRKKIYVTNPIYRWIFRYQPFLLLVRRVGWWSTINKWLLHLSWR